MVQELVVQILILLGCLFVLDRASELTIHHSLTVARITGLSNTTVGFLLVAFSTSLPELFIALFAAVLPGTIGIAIGNVLGANVADICLILGICLLWMGVRRPEIDDSLRQEVRKEAGSLYFGIFIASVIPLVLLGFGEVSRAVGAILIAIFGYHVFQLSRKRQRTEETGQGEQGKGFGRSILLVALGAAGIVVCAYFLVGSASFIAIYLGIPPVVIGATVVAFGTTIPELVTSLSATRRGHFDLALGNIIGSCFINITLILGIALVISPFTVNTEAFGTLIIFTVLTNLFLWYFLSNARFSWREGLVFLGIYAIFLIATFGSSVV